MTQKEFDDFFDEIYPPLHAYCTRLTRDADLAHDAAQESFVRMLRSGVQGERPALKVWVYKVATHIIRDQYRVSRNRERLMAENPPLEDRAAGPDEELARKTRVDGVRTVMEGLQPRDRALLLMRYDGFSYKEIAETLDVAATSVGTLLARAQRRFTIAYERSEQAHD